MLRWTARSVHTDARAARFELRTAVRSYDVADSATIGSCMGPRFDLHRPGDHFVSLITCFLSLIDT